MIFKYLVSTDLPPLGWVLQMDKGSDTVVVHCGAAVEAHPTFFVEGAWDDKDFAAAGFNSSQVFLGSGARLVGDELVIATPSHTLEKVFLRRLGSLLQASNSLQLLLAFSRDDVDLAYPFYVHDCLSHMAGIRTLEASAPFRLGPVSMYWCSTITINRQLSVRVELRTGTPSFCSYEHYMGHLRAAIRRLHENSISPLRRAVRYAPLSTVSGGYDSPACSVLAKEIGCTDAITFPKARSGWESDDDDGTPIADVLGLRVHAFDRLGYMSATDFPEAEFAATGCGGDEVIFAGAADFLLGKMLFTGYLGDTVWGMNRRNTNDFMRMLWPGGSSFGEFRIRTGFIHLPVPMLAYRSHASIVDISNDPAMVAWRVGGGYDRPIPRRLVEEAGVPRALFGKTKMAAAQSLVDIGSISGIDQVMSPTSHEDFQAFLKQVPPLEGVDRLAFWLKHQVYRLQLRVVWRLEAYVSRQQLAYLPQPWLSKRYAEWPSSNLYTFHWGIRRQIAKYANAFNRA